MSDREDAFAVLAGLQEAEREDHARADRFRSCPVNVNGEPLRLRRLSLALAAAMRARLKDAGENPAKREAELLHLCQISLVPTTNSALRFPGEDGQAVLREALKPERIRLLGEALVEWNALEAE